MPKRVSEIAITFKSVPHALFSQGGGRLSQEPNVLALRIQPDEGITLKFLSKIPGPTIDPRPVTMDFRYGTAFGGETSDAYERLLLDAMLGDGTLFARRDEVEEAWRIVDSIVAGWDAHEVRPLPYEAGSWGPDEAAELLGEGREWRKP